MQRSFAYCGVLLVAVSAEQLNDVTVDPSGPGLPFDGHGGLSAGASSRLLFDYAEPARSEILDYLYKPKFGANLHICKVEIGGDTQSTDGTEPSHMHTRDDLNCTRGYEFWLMKQAKKRNPDVITYGLPWGSPGWIDHQTGYYGPDQITYQVNWLKCARDWHGIDVTWLGLWNERPWGTPQFVKDLKKAIDAEGLKTKLVLGDGGMPNVLDYSNDTEFMAAFDAVGLHYPCTASALKGSGPGLLDAKKAIWASEDWWSEAEWPGAACWAKLFNQYATIAIPWLERLLMSTALDQRIARNFIRANLTATISWSTIWSVYPVVDVFEGNNDKLSGDGYWGPGLMCASTTDAWQPWSGHYVVPPTVWASAHTTQFAAPGWKMLNGASGELSGGGSYLTMVSPDGKDFATIVETGHASCNHCGANNAASAASTTTQKLSITLAGDLASTSKVEVWHTSNTTMFEHTGKGLTVSAGKLSMSIDPESIYTVTTTTGQSKGAFASPPAASAPFPADWSDDFDSATVESLAKYWADQCGSFQVMPAGGGRSGNTLLQRVTERPGANKWAGNLDNPLTALGNPTATAPIKITVDVRAPEAAFVNSTPDAVSRTQPSAAAPPTFKYQAGRITGGGLKGSPFMATLDEAEAACVAHAHCNAITFAATQKDPEEKASMWLTSLTKVGQQDGWQSYLIDPPRPAPPPPPAPLADPLGAWLGVCGRVTEIGQNRNMGGTSKGVCLQLNATKPTGGATWQLEENGTKILASGQCMDCDLSKWVPLALDFTVDGKVAATVNGQTVDPVNTMVTAGMISLTTGWHVGEFDNFAAKSSSSV